MNTRPNLALGYRPVTPGRGASSLGSLTSVYPCLKEALLKKTILILLILGLVVAACGGDTTATTADTGAVTTAGAVETTAGSTETTGGSTETTAGAEGMDALIAAAQEEGTLTTIALPHDWCNYGEVISTFSEKYGIDHE